MGEDDLGASGPREVGEGSLKSGEGRLSAAGHKSQRRVLTECKVNPTVNKQ